LAFCPGPLAARWRDRHRPCRGRRRPQARGGQRGSATRTLLACPSIAISSRANGSYLGKPCAVLASNKALSAESIRAEATLVGESVRAVRPTSACNG
jgi:hypothetical protein